ncbi:3-hydroxyacyl-CoA dehydrogenase family protein [Actinosynnema pretiosum subsp. pretiosum]|uniref:3-hydroxyacyl-CoA dehydrogenase NAD-binding n=2 Tax=Actinosynnema TaxID=40566 RepID=C6WJE1_ACTMD|nr:3-hydroxyacyl-CoA dehydrogenase family protein [Actinosynnema mirum]ACU34573.1 3-hydroxyacyl-CoA dehydrogenase NAD-binding [Actinosynnema mirum DSM 43827]AXX27933.1 3-hydroxybutyryl-CoA dehydrogenase [Actinosynnema pretiosum subsp. pretiosum]QUF07643.1 3-hydroxyacyl-CoA dehydrogenase family protein [Actinosynnema pretiosum subsp. pretiosum]
MIAAVIGGGTMGAGIAHVLLAGGHRVVLVEAGAERVAAAGQRVERSLAKADERGKLPAPPAELLARLTVARELADLAPDVELVVEAVPEDAALKRAVLAAAATACPDAVLASNTSSLSITALAEGLPGERVLGLHFFNPVPVQPLVELVRHDGVDPDVLARARTWAESLGKTVIEVRDSPGFATSRLGVAVGLEAIRMLEEGVADAEGIDTGMRLGYNWPVGPLRLTDLVGLDVRLAIAEHLEAELGPRFAPPALLRAKVARGELGRKSGQGFFAW